MPPTLASVSFGRDTLQRSATISVSRYGRLLLFWPDPNQSIGSDRGCRLAITHSTLIDLLLLALKGPTAILWSYELLIYLNLPCQVALKLTAWQFQTISPGRRHTLRLRSYINQPSASRDGAPKADFYTPDTPWAIAQGAQVLTPRFLSGIPEGTKDFQ